MAAAAAAACSDCAAAAAAAVAGRRQSHQAGWLEQEKDVLDVWIVFRRLGAISAFGFSFGRFWNAFERFGKFWTLRLVSDSTRVYRYFRVQVLR